MSVILAWLASSLIADFFAHVGVEGSTLLVIGGVVAMLIVFAVCEDILWRRSPRRGP